MIKINYKCGVYVPDLATLKVYGNKYKVTLHKYLRQKGYEFDSDYKSQQKNDEKLDCNISRARSKIFEYAACNEWQYFVNLTLDKKKYDRHNLKEYISSLTQWLRNYKRKHNTEIQYLFIPEQHQDGAWHIHGLINGIPDKELKPFIEGKHPQKLIDKGYLNWDAYSQKFGYVSVGKIQNHEAVSKYLTKYISKDMSSNNRELGAHLYYCSNGLNLAAEIKRGGISANMTPDYENDYVKVQWFSCLEDALSLFSN